MSIQASLRGRGRAWVSVVLVAALVISAATPIRAQAVGSMEASAAKAVRDIRLAAPADPRQMWNQALADAKRRRSRGRELEAFGVVTALFGGIRRLCHQRVRGVFS